jgi:hypothetical protein
MRSNIVASFRRPTSAGRLPTTVIQATNQPNPRQQLAVLAEQGSANERHNTLRITDVPSSVGTAILGNSGDAGTLCLA